MIANRAIGPYLRREADQVYLAANGRCNLAVEDRDLLAEASDLDACTEAALTVIRQCYPPIFCGTRLIVNPMHN